MSPCRHPKIETEEIHAIPAGRGGGLKKARCALILTRWRCLLQDDGCARPAPRVALAILWFGRVVYGYAWLVLPSTGSRPTIVRTVDRAIPRYHLCDSPMHSVCLVVRRKTRKDFLGSRGASPCRSLRRFQNRKPPEGRLSLRARQTSTAPLAATRSFKKTAPCTS